MELATVLVITNVVTLVVAAALVARMGRVRRQRAHEVDVAAAIIAERRGQALELNDNVLQGVIVAKMALERGDRDRALANLGDALDEARGIITNLLVDVDVIEPGLLRRDAEAGKRE